jgi:hypothetical protein
MLWEFSGIFGPGAPYPAAFRACLESGAPSGKRRSVGKHHSLEIVGVTGDNKDHPASARRQTEERSMTSASPPDLDRFRSLLRLLAEMEFSPRLRVKHD